MRRGHLLRGRQRTSREPVAPPSERTRAAYGEVPYPGLAFPQSHPDRLATNARLTGMKPAAPGALPRMLELGCGDGGNLIPMAATLESSEFVELDLEQRPRVALATGAGGGAGRAQPSTSPSRGPRHARSGQARPLDYLRGARRLLVGAAGRSRSDCSPSAARCSRSRASPTSATTRCPAGTSVRWCGTRCGFHGRERDWPGDRLDAAREMLAVLAEGIPGDDPYQRFSAAYAERVWANGATRGSATTTWEPLNRPILFTDFLARGRTARAENTSPRRTGSR